MVQILGKKKCTDTKKAERFFKERRIPVQLRNMEEKPLSKGEWKHILAHYTPEELLDRKSQLFIKKGMEWMEYDPLEEMQENPSLIRTPVIRYEGKVTLGYTPQLWTEWDFS
jgi:arsenate reductase-like glutaredoxin family protein